MPDTFVAPHVFRARVSKYIPNRLFGFAGDDSGMDFFFHLGSFFPGPELESLPRCSQCLIEGCGLSNVPPPPILGERVLVTLDPLSPPSDVGRPRATKVERISPPLLVVGTVETYDSHRGYGFVRGSDSISYHLHQSEISDGRLPLTGSTILFFAGLRNDRPRACHVKVCR